MGWLLGIGRAACRPRVSPTRSRPTALVRLCAIGIVMVLCLAGYSNLALAQSSQRTLVTAEPAGPVNVSDHLYRLTASNRVTELDALDAPNTDWQLLNPSALLIPANASTWLRFAIVNALPTAQHYQLLVDPFLLQGARAYVSGASATKDKPWTTVLSYARNQNSLRARAGEFRLAAGESAVVYLKVDTDIASPINVHVYPATDGITPQPALNTIWFQLSGVLWGLLFIIFTAAVLTRRIAFIWLLIYATQSTALATHFLVYHLPLPEISAEAMLKVSLILASAASLSYLGVLRNLFADKPWPGALNSVNIAAALIAWLVSGSFLGIPALMVACKISFCAVLLFALVNAARHFPIRKAQLIWLPLGFRCLLLATVYLLFSQVANGTITFAEFEMILSGLLIFEITLLVLVFARLYRKMRERQLNALLEATRQEQQVAAIAPLLSPTRHDLRSPLSDIIGLSELVLDGPLDQQQRRYLGQVQLTARKALETINGLFSYRQEKTDSPRIEPFVLSNLLSECAQYYAYPCTNLDREIVLRCADSPTDSWLGDHVKLRQALMHCVEIFLATEDANELYIETRNRDDALEISLEINGRSQQPAQSTENAVATVRSLIESNGGRVELALKDGSSSITLYPRVEHVSSERQSGDNSVLKGKRILIADDNPTARQVIRSYLEPWGALVEEAATQTEALALLRQQARIGAAIDLLLLDFLMPDGNGVDLAKAIGLDQEIAGKTTVIIMSNAAHLISIEQAKNFGIRRILEKPVVPETLKLALYEELSFLHALSLGQPAHAGTDSNATDERSQALRVLLVEDNPISARVVTAMLERCSLLSEHVEDGKTALQRFAKQAFDIVLLDCRLPDTDGFTLCEKLREIEQIGHSQNPAYIVALTAYDDQLSKSLATEAGMDQFLSKPINMYQLKSIIDKAHHKQTHL